MSLPDVQLDRRFRGLVAEARHWARVDPPARSAAARRSGWQDTPGPATLVSLQSWDGDRFEVLDDTDGEGRPYPPLGLAPRAGAAFYLGLDHALAAGVHSLAVRACRDAPEDAGAAGAVRASWEYWAGTGRWRRLSVLRDGTAGLTRSGTLSFQAPAGMQASRVGLQPHDAPLFWLRYRLEHVQRAEGVVAPLLQEVVLNTVGAASTRPQPGPREAPLVLVRRSGAVRAAEIEDLATRTPGAHIRRARALPVRHPDLGMARAEATAIPIPGTVTVLVVPEDTAVKPVPGPTTLAAVAEWLLGHRLLTAELYVAARRYRMVEVEARVVADPRYRPEDVQEALTRRLLDYFHPLRGGAAGTGWTFGGAIHFSETYRQVLNTPGVARVAPEGVTTYVDGQPVEHGADVSLDADELCCSKQHAVFVGR
jgi:hypothetical protein